MLLAVEAGVILGWHKRAGDQGDVIVLDRLGAPAPKPDDARVWTDRRARMPASAGFPGKANPLVAFLRISPADAPRQGCLHGIIVHAFLPDESDNVPDQEDFQDEYARNDVQVSQVEDRAGIAVGGDHLDEVGDMTPEYPVNQIPQGPTDEQTGANSEQRAL